VSAAAAKSGLRSGAWLWYEVGESAAFGCHRLRFDGRECDVVWTAEGPVELAPGEWDAYCEIRDRVKLRRERLAVWNGLSFVGLLAAAVVSWGGVWAVVVVLKMIFESWGRSVGVR